MKDFRQINPRTKNKPIAFSGKSSDIKPKFVPFGSTFHEVDTDDRFYYASDRSWQQITNGGGTGGTTEPIVIQLPNIGTDTIVDYINANDSTDWDLTEGNMYYFQAIKDGYLHTYIYVGNLPKYLGASQTAAVPADFDLLVVTQLFIDGSYVVKGSNNDSYTTLEGNDEVYFKKITNGGSPLTLLGHTYNSGDPQLLTNYTQNQSIDT